MFKGGRLEVYNGWNQEGKVAVMAVMCVQFLNVGARGRKTTNSDTCRSRWAGLGRLP